MEQKCLDLEGRLSAAELARDDATTKLEHLQSAFNVAELARDDATAKLEHLQLTFNANIAQMKAQCDAKNLQYENNCNDQLERHKRERDDDLRRHRLTFTIGLAHARSNCDRLLNSAIEHKDEELRAHKRSFEEAFGSRVEEAARLVRRTDAQASDRHSQLIKDLSERIDGQFSVLSSRFDAMANDMTSVRANTGSILQTQSSLSDAVTSMCNESQRVSMSVKANMCQLTELVEGLGVTLVDVKNSVSRVPSAAMQMQAAINNVPNVLETSIQDGTKSLVSMLSAVLEHVQSISGLSPAMQSVEKFMVTLKPLPKLSSKIVRSLDVVVAGQSALERHLHLFRTDGHDIVEAMKGCQEVLGHIRTEMGSFATSHTYELGNLLLQFDSGNDEVVAQMQSIATSYDAALNAVCVSIDSLIADQVASFRDLRARMNGIAEDVQSVNDLTTAASLITDSLRTRMQDASSNMSSAIDDIVPRVTQSVTDVMVQPLSRLPTSEEVADLVAPVSRSVNSLLSAEETRQLLGSLPTSTEMRDLVAPIVSKTNSLLSSEDARKLVGGLPTSEELANVVAQRPITAEANKLLGSFRDQMCDGFSNIAAEISKRDSRALSRAAVASQPSTSTGDQSE
ncbi:hypothetical protein IF1G_05786 [Cordyceps javanica]|uniref:Uncharacterized protein n=1 Tax=Cordyceps javanica TaxID=43265 RepID=A0A545V2M4_9HYPO|nr:hypothetical protein IF1G_05786 [Cordyceps javanica]